METTYLETEAEQHAIVRQLLLDPDIARAEQLLAEAGIGYTEVARCPQASCEVCEPATLETAA